MVKKGKHMKKDANNFVRDFYLTGLDACEALVRTAHECVPGGDFRVGDFEELPFADAALGGVFAANATQYPADRLAALRDYRCICAKLKIQRGASPGGYVRNSHIQIMATLSVIDSNEPDRRKFV
jgi:hypothetical protein